ncbi:c-type cytochrome [Rhodoferax sp.]|uniref:c-type cytochrome n=1 Tax=Rhodoferax sp. TaxID=50421 RepID=UPI00374DE536
MGRLGVLTAVAAIAVLCSSAFAATPQELVRQSDCMSCHGMVHKQIGPGFAQIAERYRGDAEAPARLAGKIRNGSVGAWGRVIMPRHPKLSDADALLLARWVLSQPAP